MSEANEVDGVVMCDLYCPQCGDHTEQLHEGYCEECCKNNQNILNDFNLRLKWWDGLTDEQRWKEIKR